MLCNLSNKRRLSHSSLTQNTYEFRLKINFRKKIPFKCWCSDYSVNIVLLYVRLHVGASDYNVKIMKLLYVRLYGDAGDYSVKIMLLLYVRLYAGPNDNHFFTPYIQKVVLYYVRLNVGAKDCNIINPDLGSCCCLSV